MADRTNRTDNYTYVEGTAVRSVEVPAREEPEQKREVSRETQENRERALQMNMAYVIFLTAAAVITVFMCVNFLQLRAKGTLLQEEVTSLVAELDEAVLGNDSDYNRVMNSVDLEYVRDVAENELGMVRAGSGQIVTYEVEDGDYVRQYTDIPTE